MDRSTTCHLSPSGGTPGTIPHEPVRRRDRAVRDEAWINDLLHRAPVGALAMIAGGRPYVHTNLFVYAEDERAIYFHTARKGAARSAVDDDPRVSFSFSELGHLLPADNALEFSCEFAGVTVFGEATVVGDRSTARRALQMLLDKYAPHRRPGRDYRPITDAELRRTSVYRLAITSWSGKKKEVEADFPGAYTWDELPRLAAAAVA